MEGLWEWSYSGATPSTEFAKDGQGLSNTDYVLYVRSSATSLCVRNVSISTCAAQLFLFRVNLENTGAEDVNDTTPK